MVLLVLEERRIANGYEVGIHSTGTYYAANTNRATARCAVTARQRSESAQSTFFLYAVSVRITPAKPRLALFTSVIAGLAVSAGISRVCYKQAPRQHMTKQAENHSCT